jgi:hypothetical protein
MEYVGTLQHGMENKKSTLSHFRPEVLCRRSLWDRFDYLIDVD